MRVLLVDPPDLFLEGKGWTRQVLPTGLGHLTAVLRRDHDAAMLLPDTRAYTGGDPWGEILRAAAAFAPDVVGITAVTAVYPAARRLVALFAEQLPSCRLVLGGVHVTFRPDEAARLPGVDAVVTGEGEESLLALLAGWEAEARGAPFDPASIPGVVVADDGGRVRHGPPRRPIADLDALPFPDREAQLFRDDLQPAFFQSLITLRGCPYRCIYCSVPSGPEGRTRYRSPDNVTDEIARLRDRHGASYLFFHDSVFTLHRRRTLELCDTLAARGVRLPFAIQTRTDRVDEELLDRLVEVGLHQVFFGIESGDDESLRLIRKAMPRPEIRRAVDWVRRRGVRATGFFMIGFPWEQEEQIRRTADFACELGLDALSLFSATPLPGTELWEMSRQPVAEAIDFRGPALNLTALPDQRYAELVHEVRARFDEHNQRRLNDSLSAWPGSGLPGAP